MCPLPKGIAAEQFPPPDELLGIAEAAESVVYALSQYWLIDGATPELNPAQGRWCPSGNDTEDVKAFFLGAMARILVPMDRLAGLVAGLAPDYLDGVETKLPADILPRIEGNPIRGWPFGVHCAVAQVKAFKGEFRADEPMPLETLQQLVRAANALRNAVTGSENDARNHANQSMPCEKALVELRNWAQRQLKGKQRRVLELTIESGGECAISDLAIDPAIEWDTPCDEPFNSIRKAVNSKLKKIGWKLERNNNRARLARAGQK
ncbi:MAG: hypothetical protein GXX96_31050 [Planctomycetaceae bacterium]|nr:hypothetical protein [Planctomycetaceae bacterium]